MNKSDSLFVSFQCESVPLEPNTPGVIRDRSQSSWSGPAIFVSFDCESVDLPPGTKAEPRPPGRERLVDGEDIDRRPPEL